MDKRVKRLWLRALRSGKYKQATGALRTERSDGQMGFCCLGVLCDVYKKENSDAPQKWTVDKEGLVWRFGRNESVLPAAVRKWAGLKESDPHIADVIDGIPTTSASEVNDEHKARFAKIANLIERNL